MPSQQIFPVGFAGSRKRKSENSPLRDLSATVQGGMFRLD
jgi:hypothetical protein